ncbi:MAG TPA: flavodoxin domain-containing protein, partial [Kofleriaceae bacterium]
MKKVLVTYGSLRGGTEGIALEIAKILRARGLEVDCLAAPAAHDLAPYDAVVIGGALYARRWVRSARRFVIRHQRALRGVPVWMFSSGPLDASASRGGVPQAPSVAALAARIGARGHMTFGGRLAPDASGFLAHAMAKQRAGDWRDWSHIDDWAAHIAVAIAREAPRATPSAPPPMRWVLATICAAVAVTAIAGGLALLASPDGALLHAPRELLARTPFASFALPGAILVVAVGLTNALAAIRVVREAPTANQTAIFAGVVLFGWIVCE